MLTESDEEILIDDDEENDCLNQVVIHPKSDGIKGGTAQGLLDKVSDVLRKISTGSKTSNEAGSRKVSRNESERRYVNS